MTEASAVITPDSVLQRLRDEGGPLTFFQFFGSQEELEQEDRAELKRCLDTLKAAGRVFYSSVLHAYTLSEAGDDDAPATATTGATDEPAAPERLSLDEAAEALLDALTESDHGMTFDQLKTLDDRIAPVVAGLAVAKLKRTGRARRTTHMRPSTWYVLPQHEHVAEWDAEAGRQSRAKAETDAQQPEPSAEPGQPSTPAAEPEPSPVFALEPGPGQTLDARALVDLVAELRAAYVRNTCDAEVLEAYDRALEALGTSQATTRSREVLHQDRAAYVKIRVGPQTLQHLDEAEMALAHLARYFPLPTQYPEATDA